MENERAQIVMKVQPLSSSDRANVVDALLRMESVSTATVDVKSGVVRVDGAASDIELLQTMERMGKHAVIITHTRGVTAPPPRMNNTAPSQSVVKAQLFVKLLKKQLACCSN
mmetsp:Transcript_17048/g.36577  ORF Transcript_17048/g.36577 Transcript_17048/m.36577 type:complete len:112 (-) Transcript_17048:526-861(-)